MLSVDSSEDWEWSQENSVSWTLGKLKPHKLSGGKNNEKHWWDVGQFWKMLTHVIKILEREDRAEVFESIMVRNFLKLITEIKGKSRNFREFK